MNLRTTAITAIAFSTFAVPTGLAAAGPLPDPTPPRARTAVVTDARTHATLTELREAHVAAPWAGKRRIHNEMTLLLNVGHATL